MKYIKIVFIAIIVSNTMMAFAQHNHDYNWIYRQMKLDFNDDTLKITEQSFPSDLYIANTTINSKDGRFIGYSNGCAIYNVDNDTISGSEMLNYNDFIFYDNLCINSDLGYVNGYQGIMTLYENDTIYLIHEMVNFNEEGFYLFSEALFYSKLLFLDDTLSLLEREVKILNDDTLGTGNLTTVKHSNDKDWWIIKHDLHSNCYYSILFNGSDFTNERYDCLGGVNSKDGDGGGGAVFSPQGDSYARFTPADSLNIFDFSRSTGELSNSHFIDVPQDGISGGISFSPSGQFLYVSDRLHIRQYDVWSEDVAGSEVIVAEYDGFQDEIGQGTTFGQMQLAPDCRIYLNTGPTSPFLHVIMRPDEKGLDCQVEQHSISLPEFHGQSMPHFPNYRLGTDQPFCDSTKVVVLNGTMPPVSTVDLSGSAKVYPNPASSFVNILVAEGETYALKLIDVTGHVLRSMDSVQGEMTLDIRDVPDGVYFLQLMDTRGVEVISKKLIKI